MYIEPKHIVSSYTMNNIGYSIYDTIRQLKPKKVIDFGLLYGYSTVCIAQAIRDNGFGEVVAYDLFEEYPYKASVRDIVEHNLDYFNLKHLVTLKKLSFDEWLNMHEDFDLLHLDISNTGDTIDTIYSKFPNKTIIFEGGTVERDNCNWMRQYNKRPINDIQSKVGYTIINNAFPGLSKIN